MKILGEKGKGFSRLVCGFLMTGFLTGANTLAESAAAAGGINLEERVKIGGTEQWILIRGADINKPVLLLIHGGPGTPELGLFRYYNSELENHFVVVYWDQRGAGKSYSKKLAQEPMHISQFVDDVCELSGYLCDKFGRERIGLLGHSWGTLIGMLAVAKTPERFYGYIGAGQVADMPAGELISYRYALDMAQKAGNRKAVRQLRKIGEPVKGVYKRKLAGTNIARRWVLYYGGMVCGKKSNREFARKTFGAREYSLRDKWRYIKGFSMQSKNRMVVDEFLQYDLTERVKAVETPVYFFLGRHDYTIPATVAADYFAKLKAPEKGLVWFERSGHLLPFEEPEKFNRKVIELLADEKSD